MQLVGSILLLLTPASQAWLAYLLLRRRAQKRFRWFLVYTLFSVVAAVARWSVRRMPWEYFYVYWMAEALYAVLGFLAINESFRWVFRHFYKLWNWFQFLLPAVGALMLAIAVLKGVLSPPIQAPPLLAVIFVCEFAIHCLQGGIFALFVLLVRFHSLPPRTYAFGIAVGFAISSFGIFLTVLLRSEFGTKFAPALELTPAVTYMVAVAIWLAFFLRPEPPDPLLEVRMTPEQVIQT